MNIKDLNIFVTVAREKSFNQAAKQLNYVQSNITSRIQKLEEEFAVKLFYRHRQGITLTHEGELLLPYAKKVIGLVEKMKAEVGEDQNLMGKLAIASVETVIQLPLILSKYVERYPEVDLTLSTGVTAQLTKKVLEYELDGAFVTKSSMTKAASLNEIDVFKEKLVIIAGKGKRDVKEVIQMPIIRFSDGCGYRAKLDEYLHDYDIKPTKVMELGTLETTLGSVISGLGIAYVPYAAVQEYEAKGLIDCYRLPEQYSDITTVFIYRKDDYITPSLAKFVEVVKEVNHNLERRTKKEDRPLK